MIASPARLDWSGNKRRNPKAVNHWMRGRRLLCHICSKKTFLCDDTGAPCHKVCAEAVQQRWGGESR
ncbi:hypothetical protein [Planomonospora venezuelensis]|uniref:Uncharacterized protein n=1 Tax=Planomonospora venezuelensis TaxID=1999 RepID=A0A841DGM7_PLAVE|nr:hypothetical protein [Planomonospora venezuelensis]MBB5967873.1 hypothetical protein [Planomonospora venezuelensis]GIN03273.1 hypothetical protein Pve01_49310 [Planomonospora venezuelensis]